MHLEAIAPVDERDWVRLTQAQFGPTEIEPGFWIVPTWSTVPAGAERVIRLDPGLAFGTGTHPDHPHVPALDRRATRPHGRHRGRACSTTAAAPACWRSPPRCSARASIDAVDIDPAAVEATRANACANGVALRCGAPDLAQGDYALVLANILATPLRVLAPLLCERVATGGHLVLAGILERQAAELQAGLRAVVDARGRRPRRRLDPDDRRRVTLSRATRVA